MKKLTLSIAISLLLAATSAAEAGLIVSTLDSTIDPVSSSRIDKTVFHAAEFTTDAQTYNLTSASVILRLGSSAGAITAFLYDDASGLPGSQILTFTPFSPTVGGDQTVIFTASTLFVLEPNTTYHLALNSPTSTDSPASRNANWGAIEDGTFTFSGPGSTADEREVSGDGGLSWVRINDHALLFSIEGAAVSVPAPTSLGLLGAGMLVISLKRRQRRKWVEQRG